MKIRCHCGETIIDQTDYLPHKAYLIPDQDWFAVHDGIDDEVIDLVAEGCLRTDAAYMRARHIIGRNARLMWQCRACGRLYIDGPDGQLRCFAPEGGGVDREILRSRHDA